MTRICYLSTNTTAPAQSAQQLHMVLIHDGQKLDSEHCSMLGLRRLVSLIHWRSRFNWNFVVWTHINS